MVEGATFALLGWAHRHRRIVAVCVLAVVAAITPLLAGLRFDSDVLNLLPQGGPAVRHFRAYLEAFGNLDRLYVAIEAPPGRFVSEYTDEIEGYAARVRALPGVRRVDAGPTDAGERWDYVLDNALMLLGPDRKLLDRFEADGMRRELDHARARLTLPSAGVATLVREDPLGLVGLLRAHLVDGGLPFRRGPGADGYVTPDGASRLLIVEPTQPPFDTAFSRRLLDALEGIEAGLPGGAGGDLTFRYAGAYRASTETENLIKSEGITNGIVSLTLVLLLVYAVFRSLRVLVAAVVPLVLALAVAIAVNGLWWPLSTAATGCAAMLFGVGIDGVLLLYVRYLEERGRGLHAGVAVGRLTGSVHSMWLGFATTAVMYFALTLIDLPSLNEVGRLIGVAILVSGAAAVVIVPTLLPRGAFGSPPRGLSIRWIGRVVSYHPRAILWCGTAMTVVAMVVAVELRVVPTLDRLQPRTEGMAVEREILSAFAVPEDTLLIVAEGVALEPLLEAQWVVAGHLEAGAPEISLSSPGRLLPPPSRQAAGRRALRDSGLTPEIVVGRLRAAAAASGFRPDAFVGFERRLPHLLDRDGGPTLAGYRDAGLGDLVDRYVTRTPRGYMTVAYAYPRGVADQTRVESIVAASGQPVFVTGATLVDRELAAVFRPELARGAAVGVIASLVLAFVSFGRVGLTLLSMLPTAVGLVWSAAALTALGVELDLFSVFALLMCVGIGVDYSIHVLHRQMSSGLDVVTALERVSPALVLAWATTCIGFGTLTMSDYGPLQSLGLVSVVTLTACLLSSLLLLPAVVLVSGRRGRDAASTP